jgi:hypothetical protein
MIARADRQTMQHADYWNNLATCVSNYPDQKDECIEIYERCGLPSASKSTIQYYPVAP